MQPCSYEPWQLQSGIVVSDTSEILYCMQAADASGAKAGLIAQIDFTDDWQLKIDDCF